MSSSPTEHTETTGMPQALTLLFAVSGGAAVGNLYWAQPLLSDIAGSLGVSVGTAGMLITVTQIGYALGILLVVPLGDTMNRRRLIPAVMICSAAALVACALASSFATLLAALAAVGLTTIAGQLLTPLAGDLAKPEQRGRVVGTIVSGLITGILLSRTISGFLAHAFGWRAIYIAAALFILLLAALLSKALPTERPRPTVPYGKLLLSVFTVVHAHRPVQITLIIGACAFAVFTLFWTGLTFLLSSPPFSYSVSQIGLVGLVGLAGALAARRAGSLHDRGLSVQGTGAALALGLTSLLIAGFGSTHIIPVLVAVLLLDVAIQATNVLNQSRLLSIDPASRSRLNTAFVACNFIGGAIGSLMASVLWEQGGWVAVVAGGSGLIVVALTVWLTQRKSLEF
ncbi:putative MFS family arabinose efflux permease [Rhizobium sp. PP-F2F-G38]|nr:putative MFS family arabinose efflux permease [Rhizobium sp. PP-WC-1G-195]PYE93602.1 putative MFS family arabinose efflux permease [Rhizobium sp. PP-F2F-G38]TCQ03552.1 putative MFS family arabinose efflux permease [Rhizobium sp. PP-F2F-G36]